MPAITFAHQSLRDISRTTRSSPIKCHQAEYNRLSDRIHATYVDKLDGLVEIERHQNADKSYLDEGVALLDLRRADLTGW
jgi:site-specific DNA recombinase